jgi:hypothetical protein
LEQIAKGNLREEYLLRTYVILLILLVCIILVGCSKGISKEDAEKIAIDNAIAEGYSNPEILTKYEKKTSKVFHFSVKDNKDVEVWEVTLQTSDREHEKGMLGDIIYYIDIKDGDIVDKISAID